MENDCLHTRYVQQLTARLTTVTRDLTSVKLEQLWLRGKVATFKEESDSLGAQLKKDPNYEVQSRFNVALAKYAFYDGRLKKCNERFMEIGVEFSDLMCEKMHLEAKHNIKFQIPPPPPASWPP